MRLVDVVREMARSGAGRVRVATGLTIASIAAATSLDATLAGDALFVAIEAPPGIGADALVARACAVLCGEAPPPGRRQFLPEALRRWRGRFQTGRTVVLLEGDGRDGAAAAAVVHLADRLAEAGAGVVVVFAGPAPGTQAYVRIGYDALTVDAGAGEATERTGRGVGIEAFPVRGVPHPLSWVEERMAALIRADPELAPLFRFNEQVATRHLGRPIVDACWSEGRLAVEFDGPEHREAAHYRADRQRDYELASDGWAVLRIDNVDVRTDAVLQLAKIRDMVSTRRAR